MVLAGAKHVSEDGLAEKSSAEKRLAGLRRTVTRMTFPCIGSCSYTRTRPTFGIFTQISFESV
jgi:hypothetical protein